MTFTFSAVALVLVAYLLLCAWLDRQVAKPVEWPLPNLILSCISCERLTDLPRADALRMLGEGGFVCTTCVPPGLIGAMSTDEIYRALGVEL